MPVFRDRHKNVEFYMKKLLYFLAAVTLTQTVHTISFNPVSYIKTDVPLTLNYAKSSYLHGLVAGFAFHVLPYLFQNSTLTAGTLASLATKTWYENYSAAAELEMCKAIAQTWNDKATNKVDSWTPFTMPAIKAFGPEQFKMQNESYRAAATVGGFITGYLHADALCRGISYIVS